ncbi:MAG TPA: MBL fold metallo-hydrolase [Acidimicrobiales bacterium]
MGTKQEQQPARKEIIEVAPGVLVLQLDINFTGLGHVNCYAMEDERGFALVDPGLPGPRSWQDLETKLDAAGIPLNRIHSVIVTHSHPDHFGGAARLRHETGADIVTHRSFRLWWESSEPEGEDPEVDERPALRPPFGRPTPWGGKPYEPSEADGRSHAEMRESMATALGAPRPSVRLDDAEVARYARRDWVAVHTPGHTPDHLCLFDPVEGVLLSGDHVLPSITPHISGLGNEADPLAEFFRSLDRMEQLEGVRTVLPAHGFPFSDLHGRVNAIKLHHYERLEKLRSASRGLGRPAPVNELMQHLFSERVWGSMAESETYAHLQHLRFAGEAHAEWRDDVLFYEIG